MWRVCHAFYDLEDGKHYYATGDAFPREGKAVSDERIQFLASDKNLLRTPVIKEVRTTKRKKKAEE